MPADNFIGTSVPPEMIRRLRVTNLGAGPHFTVDGGQPFPIYGWLDVQWDRAFTSDANAAPALTAAGNRFVLFATATDGRIFCNPLCPGAELPGLDRGGRRRPQQRHPAAAAVRTYMFVAVQGQDGNLYLNQGDVSGRFLGWGRATRMYCGRISAPCPRMRRSLTPEHLSTSDS